MTKENLSRRDFLELAILATAGSALACSRADVAIYEIIKATPSPTPFIPKEPTPSLNNQAITDNIAPEVRPTEIPRNPLLIEGLDFSKKGLIKIETKLGEKLFITDFNLLLFKNELAKEEVDNLINSLFRPGEKRGLVAVEKYQNIVIYLHSGYLGEKPLEAEPIRAFIEGYHDSTITNQEYFLGQLKRLEGETVKITQNNTIAEFEIKAAAQIPHQSIDSFRYLTDVVDSVIGNSIGNSEGFKFFRENRGVMLIFCGWGPENASRSPESPDYRYTYTYYILGLKPKE